MTKKGSIDRRYIRSYRIYPPLLAQNSQKVRVMALKTVVAAQTLPVSVPSWPICFAMT